MKWFPYVLVALLAFGVGWFARPFPDAHIEIRSDTVFSTSVIVRRDTVDRYLPDPLLCWHTGDTIYVSDTLLPVEQKIYRDSNYTAYVSGYMPRLDSLSLYPKTMTVTNDIIRTVKAGSRRWGIGITAGYGLSKDGLSPAIVAGINYRIW